MKLMANVLGLAAIAAIGSCGSSHTLAAELQEKPGRIISLTLSGEAAAYCYKQTHPDKRDLPSGLRISTTAILGQVLPNGWLRFNADLPAPELGKLLTISFTVSPRDIDKNHNVEVAKAREVRIRTWSLQDEFVKEID